MMKTKLFFWLVFLSIGMQAQNINFPDANFKTKLLEADTSNQIAKDLNDNYFKIDANNDGEVQVDEAENVKKLHIGNSNISSIEGIGAFTNLQLLDCSYNNLTALPSNLHISPGHCGIALIANHNFITNNGINWDSLNVLGLTIDLSYNAFADDVIINDNIDNIISFDLSHNSIKNFIANASISSNAGDAASCGSGNSFIGINLSHNALQNIQFKETSSIVSLDISSNPIASFDCPKLSIESADISNTSISYFNAENIAGVYCTNNTATKLKIKGIRNTYWTDAYCIIFNNPNLKSIDLSELTTSNAYYGHSFYNNPNLEQIFTKNGNIDWNYSNIDLSNNPKLKYICCDENEINYVQDKINQYGIINCTVDSNCDPVLDLDAGFKAMLLKTNENTEDTTLWRAKDVNGNYLTVDANNDGEIQKSEAEAVGYLRFIQGVGYTDKFETTKGINQFTNLREFSGIFLSMNSINAGGGTVGSIDITGLQYLEYLDFKEFSVESVKVENCAKLKTVVTGDPYNYPGHTTFYDFKDCPLLEDVKAVANNLESLIFQNCPSVKYIDVTGNKLSSLDVTSLLNLEKLYIGNYYDYSKDHFWNNYTYMVVDMPNNQITTIDLSLNKKLRDLDCNKNALLSLDVLSCPLLEHINCSNNQLTSLDVHGLNLTLGNVSSMNAKGSLDCSYNNITNLNIDNTIITSLFCNNNNISTLDLSKTSIGYLNCSYNNLSDIDLTNQLKLLSLDCRHNNLTSLDLNYNFYLNDVIAFNDNPRLENLFMKNGNNQAWLFDYSLNDGISPFRNTDIKYICADDSEMDELKANLQMYNLFSTNINSYCSFTPGGSYNTISGAVKIDSNNNGCDANDNPFEFLKLKINDGTTSGETFVQQNGKYEFYTQAGNFNITALAENPALFTISPANFSTSFADSDNNIFTQDICVTANGTQNDAEVVIAPLTGARPGFEATYKLVWRNKGNTTLSGKIVLNYDQNKMTFQSSSMPYAAISNGSLEFNYSNLKPYANEATELIFTINTPTNPTNPVNSGDILSFNAQITPNASDLTPEDNNFKFDQTVVNSFDPNDITCMEGEIIPTTAVGKYMHYVVNFENTGTAEAENIVVKMKIDPAEFDINTLQLQNASSDVTTVITGNDVEFKFKKIKLKAGGHGNVLLKVRSVTDLQEGDSVDNSADIYFDYNFPITTNEYVTTILDEHSLLNAKINYEASEFASNNYKVNFDASLSTGNITSYAWEFPNAASVSSTSAIKPMVTYNVAGNYTAKLTISDVDNNLSVKTITFKVGNTTADLSTGRDNNGNAIAIDADDDDWKGYDINGTEITPKIRHTYPGWSYADIGNGNNSQWISLNNFEGYYNYKSRAFTIPNNATDAKLNLRSLSFVRNWTYLVKVEADGSETETEITKTQWQSDGFKGWLNSRSPKVDNYSLSPGTYYIKVLVYSNNSAVRESLDVNAIVTCSTGLMNANKLVPPTITLQTQDVIKQNVSVYPVPTHGELNIDSDSDVLSVEVHDVLGRILQKKHFAPSRKVKLTINNGEGVYFLKIMTKQGIVNQKIIKE